MPDKARNRMVLLTRCTVKKDDGSPWNVRLAASTPQSRMASMESKTRSHFSPRSVKPCSVVNLPDEKLYRVLDCLSEGCSVRTTARLCDVHISTVLRVLRIAGEKCERVLQEQVREVSVKEVQ